MAPILNELKVPFEEIDVDTIPEKRECYGNEIPVVEINGEFAYKHRIPPLGFRRRLETVMS